MKRLFLSFVLIFVITSVCDCQTTNNKGVLTVKLIGFRNDIGQTCVSLFNQAKGFPGKYANAYKITRSAIKGRQATIEFADLPYGFYAVSVIHDENMNNKLETSFIGIPKEGCGASNNPKSFMGPPSFDASKFELKSNSKIIEIVMKYW